MDRADWIRKLEAEEKELRGSYDFTDVFGKTVAPGSWFDICRARAVRGLRDAIEAGLYAYENEIEVDYATLDDRAHAFQRVDAQRRAQQWALEARALMWAMVRPDEELAAEHVVAWEMLPTDEREMVLRLMSDDRPSNGTPCACKAPFFFRAYRCRSGDVKCTRCGSAWPLEAHRGSRPQYFLPRERAEHLSRGLDLQPVLRGLSSLKTDGAA